MERVENIERSESRPPTVRAPVVLRCGDYYQKCRVCNCLVLAPCSEEGGAESCQRNPDNVMQHSAD